MFMSKQILVFGDSIAYGAWDEEGGWVEKLKVFTNKKSIKSNLEYYCAVYNLAIDGNTTENLLNRLDFEIKQRVCGEEIVFLFAIGLNDSAVMNMNNIEKIPPEKFRQNIKELISMSKIYSTKIIFFGILPVDELKVDPIPWSMGKSYKNDSILRYNDIIKSVCQEYKIDFVGLFEEFKKEEYRNLLEDGAHPNSAGHEKIYEIISGYLEKKKII